VICDDYTGHINDTKNMTSCRLSHLSVGVYVYQSVRKVYCGKTADLIRMTFGLVSGVGRGMGVLDGVVIVEREGAVLGVNVGRPTETKGGLCCVVVYESDALFPN